MDTLPLSARFARASTFLAPAESFLPQSFKSVPSNLFKSVPFVLQTVPFTVVHGSAIPPFHVKKREEKSVQFAAL